MSFEEDKISANPPKFEKYSPDHIPKGWGYELWIINSLEHGYCGKLLFFKKGLQCSWHVHEKKDEAFHCKKGRILLLVSEDQDQTLAKEIILEAGDCYHVKRGQYHRMRGLEHENELFEFSTLHREDDSIRIEKGD